MHCKYPLFLKELILETQMILAAEYYKLYIL